jgi:exopolyphosphatase/guanosine-5'-triphosphate,3'-diphosphate pyrophosphatase
VKSDPIAADELEALTAFLDETLAPLELPQGAPLVGTAGTVTTLAAVSIGLEPYDAARVHGMTLGAGEVIRQITDEYAVRTNAQRKDIAGLDDKRADVILAGAMIVGRTMERVGATTITVSDRGVRWGLAYELIES